MHLERRIRNLQRAVTVGEGVPHGPAGGWMTWRPGSSVIKLLTMRPSSNIRLFETCCVLLAVILSASAAGGQMYRGAGSVRDSADADVHSGPVSDFSSGPVTSGHSVAGSGAVSDTKSYSFTHNVESLIGPGIPTHSLSRLQEQMHAIQTQPREGVAAEEIVPAEPLGVGESPAGEPVTELTPEEEIAPEESSEPQPEVKTPGPKVAEPTPGEEPSEETQPEGETGEAESAPELTPTPQREMSQPKIYFWPPRASRAGGWIAKSTNGM